LRVSPSRFDAYDSKPNRIPYLAGKGRYVLARLLLLFILVPLVELSLLMYVAKKTDWWIAATLVIVTGIIGTMLARSQGVKTYRRIHLSMTQGQIPTDALIDAAMIFVAGALLLTPGMLTDLFGLSLLVPSCRSWYRRRLVRWFRARFTFQAESSDDPSPKSSEVIDSYVVPPKSTTIESGSDKTV